MSEAWPSGVPAPALINTQQGAPFRTPLQTDFDDGNRRQRRSSTKNIATLTFSIRMENSEFLTFKAWVRDILVDGTLPFTMDVWDGSQMSNKTCSFTQPYQDDAKDGSYHVVGVSLDVEDY